MTKDLDHSMAEGTEYSMAKVMEYSVEDTENTQWGTRSSPWTKGMEQFVEDME